MTNFTFEVQNCTNGKTGPSNIINDSFSPWKFILEEKVKNGLWKFTYVTIGPLVEILKKLQKWSLKFQNW
jgi:hypothetical protein